MKNQIWNRLAPRGAIQEICSKYEMWVKVLDARIKNLGGYVVICDNTTNPELMSVARSLGWVAPYATFMTDIDASKVESLPVPINDYDSHFRTLKSFDELWYFTGITDIDEHTFRRCLYLETVRLPENCRILRRAFEECPVLTSVRINSTCQTITTEAFSDCPRIAHFNIPQETVCEANPFLRCYNVTHIEVSLLNRFCFTTREGVLYCRAPYALLCYPSNINGDVYELIANCYEIEVSAIRDVQYLIDVIIPENVDRIKANNFTDCPALSRIIFKSPKPPFYLGEGCFVGLRSDYRIIVPRESVIIYQKAWTHLANHIFPMPTSDTGNDSNNGNTGDSVDDIMWGD